jgi:hypothetical protein
MRIAIAAAILFLSAGISQAETMDSKAEHLAQKSVAESVYSW